MYYKSTKSRTSTTKIDIFNHNGIQNPKTDRLTKLCKYTAIS